MHGHPSGVGVCLTDHIGRFTFQNGRTEERRMKAGEAFWLPGEEHLPENMGDAPLELTRTTRAKSLREPRSPPSKLTSSIWLGAIQQGERRGGGTAANWAP